MSKKTFRNAAISTMAASAAVAAVAPAAVSAEDASFPDVTQDNPHQDNIIKLAEQGIVQGDEDGNFNPYNSVGRGQIAEMFQKALDLDTPQDVNAVLEQYDDVDADSYHADAIAAVTEAGIFQGHDGEFGQYEAITREQMATVLVEAFDLDKYDTDSDVDLNTDDIGPSHKDNVQILANLDITNQLDNYRPFDFIDRGQFSTFLVEAQDTVEANAPGVENVETTVNDNDTFTIEGTATGIADGVHLVVEDEDGEKIVDNANIDIEDDGSFGFTTKELDAGDYSYEIMGMENGNHGTAKAQEGDFEVEEFTVENVNAITDTVDQDGTLEFAINGKDRAASLEELENKGYSVEFKASDDVFEGNNATSETGQIKNAHDGDSFDYQVVVSKDGEEVASTDRVKVNVIDKANTVTDIEGLEITKDGDEINNGQLAFNDKDVTFDPKVKTADGETKQASDLDGVDVAYDTDHPAILTVAADGTADIGYKGDTKVTVKMGDEEYTKAINVGDKRAASAENSSLEKDSVKFATGDEEQKVAFEEVKDQYGLDYDLTASDVTAESDNDSINAEVNTSGEDAPYVEIGANSEASGKVIVKINGEPIGNIQVDALNAGEAESYNLTTNAEDNELDLNSDEDYNVTLNAQDENGINVDAPTLYTDDVDAGKETKYVLKSSDSDIVEVQSDENSEVSGIRLADDAKAGDTAEVHVEKKAGSFNDEVKDTTIEFTVVDSTVELKEVSMTSVPEITEDTTDLDLADYITPVAADGQDNAVEVGYSVSEDVDTSNVDDDQLGDDNVWIVAKGEGSDEDQDLALGEITFMGNPLNDNALHVDPEDSSQGVNINVADDGDALEVMSEQGDDEITGTLNIDFADAEGSHEFGAFDNVDVDIAASEE